MSKRIIIDANFPNEIRAVLLNNDNIEDIEYETSAKQQNKGNIYLAKITRIEPSLQAAFIDYGTDKSGFLPFSEINPDYYNIPVSDQKISISNLKEIAPPDITSDDLNEPSRVSTYNQVIDNEEIDLKAIERLIDDKIQTELDLDASDSDIEIVDKHDKTQEQKQYKIQEVIKNGQVLLVQVTKEERGNKGASFTTFISLAGKYCVLMPNTPSQNGVSRKISNAEERKRLKNIISNLTSDINKNSSSVILRTAGMSHTTLDIKRDYDYLVRLWNKIIEATLKANAPSFIHEEEGIIQKTIRDMFDYRVKELIVQGAAAYQSAVKFMRDILPTELSRLKEYKNKTPIFTKFGIENQLSSLYNPIITLPSGGYIVINPTEALISIDVNSGKATSERNIEETATKTNLEAAKEIARHIKLRDLSGLLVIDFIDMHEAKHRKIIERSFKEFLSRDRARIQTGHISSFGLLEMSRQRMRPSFLESNATICSHCNGKGLVRADESNSMLILRTVENEICSDNVDIVNVFANISSVIYLLNNKRQEISLIETKYNIKLNFNCDPTATSDNYSIEKIKLPKKGLSSNAPGKQACLSNSDNYKEDTNYKNKQKWKIPVKQLAKNLKPNEQDSKEINLQETQIIPELTTENSDNITASTNDEVSTQAPTRRDVSKNPNSRLPTRRSFYKNNRKKTTNIVENKESTTS
jgi:ribonuclease E